MNHKRGRPKHQRMGCFCKNWKDEREAKSGDNLLASDRRRIQEDGDNLTMAAALEAVNEDQPGSFDEGLAEEMIDRAFADAYGITFPEFLENYGI